MTSHNKRVKLRNFEPIDRKIGHQIEHPMGVIQHSRFIQPYMAKGMIPKSMISQ